MNNFIVALRRSALHRISCQPLLPLSETNEGAEVEEGARERKFMTNKETIITIKIEPRRILFGARKIVNSSDGDG